MASMENKLDLKNVALYVNPKQMDLSSYGGSNFGVWHLNFVDITAGEDNARYFDRYSFTGRHFRHLRFRAQWERDEKAKGVYGQRLQISAGDDIERVEEAEAIVNILKKARKVEDNFIVRPVTFGQYVTLMCNGLGIKKFILPTEEQKEGYKWSDLEGYYNRLHKADEFLGRVIDSKIDETYFPEERQKVAS